MEIGKGNRWSHTLENLLWKRLWTYCKTDCRMNGVMLLVMAGQMLTSSDQDAQAHPLLITVCVFQIPLSDRMEGYVHCIHLKVAHFAVLCTQQSGL